MAKKYLIWGCAGHAKVLADIICLQDDEIIAFIDNELVPSIITNIPVYLGESGFRKWVSNIDSFTDLRGLVAIGGSRGADRLMIQNLLREAGIDLAPIIHPDASVSRKSSLGEGSQVLAQAVIAADSHIGAGCIVNHKASIDHECQIDDGVHLAPGATICGCVRIGNCTMVGAGAVILPRLKIGIGAIVGAGAVVTKDVPDFSVVAGNPARPLVVKRL